MKKIAIITSSRADWGLLKPVVEKINQSPFTTSGIGVRSLRSIIIATGSHLSPEHGLTKTKIDHIDHEVEILLSSDTEKGVCSAAGLTLIKFGELFDRIKPDLVLVLGDRFEILSACMAAHIHRIPIAHLHGGEVSGNTDNAWRNCITHMADIHFPATEKARDNIMRMRGFRPVFAPEMFNVHMVGALGCDGLEKRTSEPDNKFMVIYHPNTLNDEDFGQLLYVLRQRGEQIIFIRPNADNDNYNIKETIDRFIVMNPGRCSVFSSKSQGEYFEMLSECKAIIGNSSSSVIEAPALGVPSILIGDRQNGRESSESIICCEPNQESIKTALAKLESKTFQDLMKTDYYMPYKGENVAGKIVEVLNKI